MDRISISLPLGISMLLIPQLPEAADVFSVQTPLPPFLSFGFVFSP